EEESEVTLNRDITSALMLQQRMDRRKAAVYLTLSGLLIFTTAFLLGFVAFRGMCRLCGNDGDLIPLSDAAGAQHSAEGGVMYTAELREMLKKYLKEERIEDTLRRVSRASHPPGSSEGNAVAREILQNLQNLRMDHTWTDSHYATLQFPSRTQRNTLWLVDSEGAELEEIPLDSEGYCAYSATGTATGGVVYVNYGRREDFEQLRVMGVALNGSIAVARVGGAVSFAEKVWLAQEAGLVGVLIYPDPADVPQDPRRLGLHSDAVISEHVRFYPRRSLLFVSWDGGDFGNVGATEWLEGYLTMLHLKAVAYFSLDQAILGNTHTHTHTQTHTHTHKHTHVCLGILVRTLHRLPLIFYQVNDIVMYVCVRVCVRMCVCVCVQVMIYSRSTPVLCSPISSKEPSNKFVCLKPCLYQ
uniref:Transferrin receptor protein 2-like n=1 Tax=Sinocyclocheilus grahami TaxID=75366 RepID=A0A672Q449_SINGR